MKDPFFGKGDIVFNFVRQLYLLAIIVMFVSSLGNRPQGSKWVYVSAMILFAAIMLVMLYAAGFTVYLQLPSSPSEWEEVGNKILEVPTFRNIVLSLASTYGLYLTSSLLYLDPWHIFTCFVQYMLLLPGFVNILMVYAFCNTHDVSWGTKGDNTLGNDLGHVKVNASKGGKQTAEIDILDEKADLNSNYDRVVRDLAVQPKKEKKHRDAATKREDYYRGFRTRLVLVWMFTNAALVITFTSDFMNFLSFRNMSAAEDFNPYLTFLFWSVAYLSAFRFIGSTAYLIKLIIFG